MLDLNIEVISIDSSDETNNNNNNDDKKTITYFNELPDRSRTNSGTSSSSIINLEELPSTTDENSSVHNKPAYIFDILKKDQGNFQTTSTFQGQDNCLISFPVTGRQPELFSGSLSKPPWLKLSCPEGSSGQPELKVVKPKKSRRGPRSRSSQYRGVTFYRRTGRWESHIWDCGKQVYLGGFDTAHAAARAYDRAAIKFRGVDADINFEISDYEEDMKQTKNLNKEEFVQVLRRQSTGFLRGSSKYRGVNLQKCGLMEARMGQILGKKASDKAAIQCIEREAETNFRPNVYEGKMFIDTKARGSEQNLDLSLGLSAPSNSSNKHFSSMVNVPASAHVGRKELRSPNLATMHHPMWPGVHPGFILNYAGRDIEKKNEGNNPSTKLSSFTWQMHTQSGGYPTPLLSNAASSGFPSSSMTIPPNPQSFSIFQLQHLKPRF